MEDSELKDYFAKSQLLTFYYDTKVDYEDIENQLKSVIKRNTIPIDLDTPQAKQLFFKNHEFKDDTKWVQISENEDVSSTFFSLLEDIQGSAGRGGERPQFAEMWISLSDIQVVEKRKVYDLLDLLGDLGGIFSSIYFLA